MGLGWCYETGNGVPQDFNQAIAWYRKGGMEGDYQLKQLFAKYPNLNTTTPAMGASGGTPRAGQQEIAEKIADLQSDIEEHESAAEHWDNSLHCRGAGARICRRAVERG
jgi:TPR repeat protein